MTEVKKKYYIVASKFNEPITGNLVKGAMAALKHLGINEDEFELLRVPGAFEIPVVTKKILELKFNVTGVIALGCLIKGETAHFEYISEPLSNELMKLSLKYLTPVGFGVLTCYTPQQAYERSRVEPEYIKSNKGFETAVAVIETAKILDSIIYENPL